MAVDINKQLDRAKRYLERNKFEDAIEAYQAVLSDVPGHLESLQALGDVYARIGRADRAAGYYGTLFDRLIETREENRALALYARTLRDIQQPPERMVRYALLLQKQNRAEEAIEQYALASELFLARGKDEPALDCLERMAQLDPDNSARQTAVAELAERLGRTPVAARAYLRAGQISEAAGDAEAALDLLARAHQLMPDERGPALLYAQALLRRGEAARAVALLEPLAATQTDAAFLDTLAEALTLAGDLDRARGLYEQVLPERPAVAAKLFDLADRYLREKQDAAAVELLGRVQAQMIAARHENDFAAKLDALAALYPESLALAEFWAAAYASLNREAKYFDALVRLFDLYYEGGNVQGACETLQRLLEIDPYDAGNQARIDRLEGKVDAGTLSRIRSQLAQAATHTARVPVVAQQSEGIAPEPGGAEHGLDDLLVQAEIFLQYSLPAKAVERLEMIAQMFPGEIEHNERLRNLCQLANWWPEGMAPPAAAKAGGAPSESADSAGTMRDLAKIAEISQALLRLPSPRAILSAAMNEMGKYLRATRCLAVIGPPDKPPRMASEFCAPGVEPAPGVVLVRLLAQLDRASPDALGGLALDAAACPLLRELGLETVLGVVLTDRESQTPAGMVIAGYGSPHRWRPNETYFLQAIGDQLLLSISHTERRSQVRNAGAADERTGLLARTAYLDCLLSETQRAKAQGTTLSLLLLQVDRGPELLRQHGEAQLEHYMEGLARAVEPVARHSDFAVKYTSWTIALILPDTALAGAQTLAGKLRTAAAQVSPPWDGGSLTTSVSVAEAVTRRDYDNEDIVTELINRAEAGLEEARHRGGDAVVALSALGPSRS